MRISTADGTRTVVGVLGAGAADCNGLAWSDADGMLYTVNAASQSLLRVDPATGAAVAVAPTGGLFGSGCAVGAWVDTLVGLVPG